MEEEEVEEKLQQLNPNLIGNIYLRTNIFIWLISFYTNGLISFMNYKFEFEFFFSTTHA